MKRGDIARAPKRRRSREQHYQVEIGHGTMLATKVKRGCAGPFYKYRQDDMMPDINTVLARAGVRVGDTGWLVWVPDAVSGGKGHPRAGSRPVTAMAIEREAAWLYSEHGNLLTRDGSPIPFGELSEPYQHMFRLLARAVLERGRRTRRPSCVRSA